MTDEAKAEEYIEHNQNYFSYSCYDCERLHDMNEHFGVGENEMLRVVKQAFLDGIEIGRNEQRKVFAENCKRCPKKQLEKEVEELKKQIEKMKCCQNCKYMDCFGKCRRKIPSPVLYCNKWESRR